MLITKAEKKRMNEGEKTTVTRLPGKSDVEKSLAMRMTEQMTSKKQVAGLLRQMLCQELADAGEPEGEMGLVGVLILAYVTWSRARVGLYSRSKFSMTYSDGGVMLGHLQKPSNDWQGQEYINASIHLEVGIFGVLRLPIITSIPGGSGI